MSGLVLNKVVKTFGDITTIHGVDLSVGKGEFCVFVGPSGCGKSTLLRMIAGLEECTDGQIFIDDADVTDIQPSKRGIAMVFQSYALYPHMTVHENLAFGLKINKTSDAVIEEKVKYAASTLQISHLLDRRPKDLSGGQRQRVAIGRAIVRQPKLFLFDEPLSNLDAALRMEMRVELAKIKSELKTTVVYVTHDQVEAMTLADKIVVLKAGQIEQVGTPMELYERPANKFVAGFIGSPKMNFIDARVAALENGNVHFSTLKGEKFSLPNRYSLTLDETVSVGVRPEHFSISPAANVGLSGVVNVIENLGAETFIHVQSNAVNFVVKSAPEVKFCVGDKVSLTFDSKDVHLFDKNELRIASSNTPAVG